MSESRSNVATVAIVIMVIVALAFIYFVFVRTVEDDADLEINIGDNSSSGLLAPDAPGALASDGAASAVCTGMVS